MDGKIASAREPRAPCVVAAETFEDNRARSAAEWMNDAVHSPRIVIPSHVGNAGTNGDAISAAITIPATHHRCLERSTLNSPTFELLVSVSGAIPRWLNAAPTRGPWAGARATAGADGR